MTRNIYPHAIHLAALMLIAVSASAQKNEYPNAVPAPKTENTWCIDAFAGTGSSGYSGDYGPAASAQLAYPAGIALGEGPLQREGIAGTISGIFIADSYNNVVRFVDSSNGNIYTYAGNGTKGFSGSEVSAWTAELNQPTGLAVNPLTGNLYISDTGNHVVRMVDRSYRLISTVVGTGSPGNSGNGGLATAATLGSPFGLSFDGKGNLYIADTYYNVIRRVDATTGEITLAVGNGTGGFAGDGGAASAAEIWGAAGVAADSAGDLYIADTGNNRIREVTASVNSVDEYQGIITTIAGNGSPGLGIGGEGAEVGFDLPAGITLGYVVPPTSGAFGGTSTPGFVGEFVADAGADAVQFIEGAPQYYYTGIAAGDGIAGFTGNGGPGPIAEMNYPVAVAQDPASYFLYAADEDNNVVRRLNYCTVPLPLRD